MKKTNLLETRRNDNQLSTSNEKLEHAYEEKLNWMLGNDTPSDETNSHVLNSQIKDPSLYTLLLIISERSNYKSSFNSIFSENATVKDGAQSFWFNLFQQFFLANTNLSLMFKDDMLFYVRRIFSKSKLHTPHTELQVYRYNSNNQPSFSDQQINWEETVYLNIILHHFEYQITCAICTRTGEKEIQVLKKFTQKVYASPSRRTMDGKGTEEEMTYPDIFFTIDNFEEVFANQIIRDSELVCVELIATGRYNDQHSVLFLGCIRYELLKRAYDSKASLSQRMAQRMHSMGWMKGQYKRVEFVRMHGPNGKGHAEMAISRVKGSGPETPLQTPITDTFPYQDFQEQQDSFSQRRMSDPNMVHNNFFRNHDNIKKYRSENEGVDSAGMNTEVDATNIEDELTGKSEFGLFGRSFGQTWHWLKEQRRSNSAALHCCLTYVTLPWHRIIADLLDSNGLLPVISLPLL